ncbi:MAG TPA: hypothetical protein VGE07_14570 [Herpetosiphonaceae bacterium]
MGNPKSREYRRRLEHEQAWAAARETPRRFDEGVHIPGTGLLRVQFVRAPSFEQGYAWDLREYRGEWGVFRSRVVDDISDGRLIGYEELAAPGVQFQGCYERLLALSIPLAPLRAPIMGLDGTSYLLTIGEFFSAVRISWWVACPPEWQALADIVDELYDALRQLPAKEAGQ